jgi:hypothetical protein
MNPQGTSKLRGGTARQGDWTMMRVSLKPTTELLSTLREYVFEMSHHLLGDAAMGDRVALAFHELLEHSGRNSRDEVTVASVEVSDIEGKSVISVKVTNRAGAQQAAALEQTLAELRSTDDVAAYYQRALRAGTNDDSSAGFGLARVCAEGAMTLRSEIHGDFVTIVAEARETGK